VHYAKALSAGAVTFKDPFSGQGLELIDLKSGEASCRVQFGNLFE
jgi:hypothetical protein